MSYLDRAKEWCSNDELQCAAKYLRENRHLIAPNRMYDLYFNAPENTTASVMTAILLDSGVDPLMYLSDIPQYYGTGLFIGDLILPEHIKIIGERAFTDCDIESVYIPEGVRVIEVGAFSHCHNLSEVHLPNSTIHINKLAFSCDANLRQIYYNGTREQYGDIDHDPDSVYFNIDTPIHLVCTDMEDTI